MLRDKKTPGHDTIDFRILTLTENAPTVHYALGNRLL